MKTYITQHHKTIINKYYSVSCDTKKNKANYFFITLELNALIFGTCSDLTHNWKSAYDYVFHLTCVMPIPGITFQTNYILAINKTVTQ